MLGEPLGGRIPIAPSVVLHKEQAGYDKAEKLLFETVKSRQLKLPDQHPHTQESIKTLIDLYDSWGKPEDAEKWRAELPQTKM